MKSTYFRWLLGLVDNYFGGNYQKLLWKLFETEFKWELEYDGNRAADGINLRRIFCQEVGLDVDIFTSGIGNGRDNEWFFRPCSVLEMMVGLAKRAEDYIMHDPEYGDRTSVWFWEMMANLGLDNFDDFHYFDAEVDKILYFFMYRKYGPNGIGSAFPIRKKTRDLRQTDLWWQMNAYLEERYPM